MSRNDLDPGAPALSGSITHEELLARLGDPALAIINVLPRASFEEGRIPGSLSLPIAELEARAAALLPVPSQEIAVYCGGGG